MTSLLINPVAVTLIANYLSRPAHGLLLSGPEGIGLGTVAQYIAMQIAPKSYVHDVYPDDKQTIAIDTIRGLYKLTRAQRDTPLIVIIDDADSMGVEAQNALLKLLEEPASNVFFILTSHMPQQLLPTIASRTQHIGLSPVASRELDSLIPSDTSTTLKAQLLFIADGLPAEVSRLLSDDVYCSLRTNQMKDARAFLEGDTYARLIFAKTYSTDRITAQQFLASLTQMLSFMLFSRQDASYATQLETIELISTRLRQNAHVRTQLAYLVTQL